MRIIITGGTGMIGSALSAALLEEGHEVWALSRTPQIARVLPGVKVAGWDGVTAKGWLELADGAGAIINLAGESLASGRWTKERKERILSSRVKAGQAVVEAVRAARVKPGVVIQASGIGCYGPSDDRQLDESAPYGKDYLSNVCVDWEASTLPVEEMNVRRVIVRTGIVLSTRGGALAPLLLTTRWFVGGPMGSGRQWWPWIHIEDQVGAIQYLMSQPGANGAYNLVAPHPVQMAEFGRTLASVLDRPYWLPAPALAMKLLLGEMSTVVLDGQRALPARLLQAGYRFKFEKLHSALVNLLKPGSQIKLE